MAVRFTRKFPMIDPYNRSDVIKLLRQAADHIIQGVKNPQIHSDIHLLADHLETGD